MVAVSRVVIACALPSRVLRAPAKPGLATLAALLALVTPALADDTGTATKPSGTVGIAKEEDEPPKLSLPTESDRVAWTKPGFRLGLGLEYGRFDGLRGAPSGRLIGAVLHAGLRLDEDWSLMTTFIYASASQSGGLKGLRFAGTIDPTWHVTRSFSLAFGFGFGGIVEGSTGRKDAEPLGNEINTSYTFGSSMNPVTSCSGVGVAGLLRAAYTWVLGPRASTSLELEVIGQYTACVDKTGRVDDDTAQAIVRTQYWPHAGATLGWGVSWR
jgi:hypothetical protein